MINRIDDFKNEIKERALDTHKGDYGKVLIVAGSIGMLGAACLASKAALRSGSGLVYVSALKEMYVPIECNVMEVIVVDRNLKDLSLYDAILIGPGMGCNSDTASILTYILENYDKNIVIDADGLNVISKFNLYDKIRDYKGEIVVTPHMGEAKKLVGDGSREEISKRLNSELNAISVLKGYRTIVYDGENTYINETGNPGMATAGSGDVLSGIILSLLGRGIEAYKAAVLGTYIHGRAGDLARNKIGEEGLISSDIIEYIPYCFKELKER